jgi:hypothetical protein
MKKVLVLGIVSATSLLVLRAFGIRTEILILDSWVDSVLAILNV